MDRRQGNCEKAIREFNEVIARDPRNAIAMKELAATLTGTRRFRAAEKTFDRLISLYPDQPIQKVQKAVELTFSQTGNDEAFWSTITDQMSAADDYLATGFRNVDGAQVQKMIRAWTPCHRWSVFSGLVRTKIAKP